MDQDHYQTLVDRYLKKRLTDEELEVFISLMRQGKLNAYLREAMDKDLGLDEVSDSENVPVIRLKKNNVVLRWSAAAVIAGLFLCGIYFIRQQKIQSNTKNKPIVATINNLDTVRISNTTASIVKRILPDKSAVWLQPYTCISYPSKFTGQLRTVKMQGDAFFEVTKDAHHPFVITSGKILTRVWGTSFRIKAVPGEAVYKVLVLTGKVSVSLATPGAAGTRNAQLMLRPAEEAVYRNTGEQLKKENIRLEDDLLIWKKSNLAFDNASLSAILSAVNNNYNVHVTVSDKQIDSYHITANFNNKNLADILTLICKSVNCNYAIIANEIKISQNN
jgi:transmembrane sensor